MATTRHGDKAKSGWRHFVTPGWIITILLVIGFSYAAIMVLSPWQLHKDDAIVARNEHVDEAFKVDPTDFDTIFNADGSIKGDQEWMRVQVSGHFLADKEVLLRLRPVESGPSYQALTPFQLDDGRIMLVNRGFETTTAGAMPDVPRATTDEVTIVANARLNEAVPETAPMNEGGYDQVYGINTQQVSEVTGLRLGTDYLQLTDGSPGVLTPLPIPTLDRGNHLSYGFQWIAFGIMAPLGLGYMAYSEVRERRRAREEEAEMVARQEATDTTGEPPLDEADKAPAAPAQEPAAAPDDEPEVPDEEQAQIDRENQTMRSRYGDTHPNRFGRRRR